MNDLRGSQWRKWDLHFHTPSSYDYQDKNITDEVIIKVLNQNKIEVIAITDHHLIDITRINNLKKLGSEVGITVLPGIEFLSDARGKEPIHFIGIFSENCNLEYIWGQIENTTNIKNIKGSGKKPNEIYCDLIETIGLIKELGGIVSIHAGEKSNSIENITNSLPQAIAQKTDIASIIDIYELGKESDQNDYNAIVFPAIKKTIPMIICSDNHNINNYILKQNCWIKADPTFEGLKQIIYEPALRVFIGDDPKKRFQKLKIDSFKIDGAENFQIMNQEIKLNSDLVSIIGGRGSGKSALLETLALCFGKHKTGDFNDDFDYEDFGGDTYIDYMQEQKAKAKLQIKYNGLDNENSIYDYVFEDKSEKYCDFPLLYLGQNLIEEYANDSTKIHQLAFEAVLKSSGYFDDITSLQNEIKGCEADLVSITKEIEGSRLQLLSYNIDKLRSDKAKLEREIALLSSKETKEVILKLGESRLRKDNYIKVKQIVDTLIKELNKVNNESNEKLSEINSILELLKIKQNISLLDLSSKVKELEQIKDIVESLNINDEHDNAIIEAEKKLLGKTEISASYFDSLKSAIEDIDKAINSYNREEDFLKKCILDRYEQINEFDSLTIDLRDFYEIAIKKFTENHTGILKSLELKATLAFDYRSLIKDLFVDVDKRKIKDIEKFKKDFLKIDFDFFDTKYSDWLKQFEAVEENFKYFFNDGKKTFEEIAYKNYKYLDTTISYEVEPGRFKQLSNLSLGQKGTVLLKLFLSLGNNCPIIIDQPEDHLDNHFIFTDLVSTLRNAKEKRQIILVTHDANIVVNGDSEQIIVAEYNNNQINYNLSGSIENENVRKAIAKILEGGELAFTKRERKYQFK